MEVVVLANWDDRLTGTHTAKHFYYRCKQGIWYHCSSQVSGICDLRGGEFPSTSAASKSTSTLIDLYVPLGTGAGEGATTVHDRLTIL